MEKRGGRGRGGGCRLWKTQLGTPPPSVQYGAQQRQKQQLHKIGEEGGEGDPAPIPLFLSLDCGGKGRDPCRFWLEKEMRFPHPFSLSLPNTLGRTRLLLLLLLLLSLVLCFPPPSPSHLRSCYYICNFLPTYSLSLTRKEEEEEKISSSDRRRLRRTTTTAATVCTKAKAGGGGGGGGAVGILRNKEREGRGGHVALAPAFAGGRGSSAGLGGGGGASR